MGEQIKDGTGLGYLVKVDGDNRIHTDAVSHSVLADAVDRGRAWNLGTGVINLTGNATASALLYIKNTGTDIIQLDLYVIITGASTGGSGNMKVEILRNPTGGTLISSPSGSITATNMNFGSSNSPSATLSYGAEAKTLSGEDSILRSQTSASGRLLLGIITDLPGGASVGLRVTTPSGNSGIDVECIVEMFEERNV